MARSLAAHLAMIEEEAVLTTGEPVEHEVGGDVKVSHDAVIDVLMDGDDAGADRIGSRGRVERFAGQFHRAGAMGVNATNDTHERGFSGPVCPHQHCHLARRQAQIDPLQNLDGAERLVQSGYPKDSILNHASSPPKTNAIGHFIKCQRN